jgi:hypothetical protein
MKVFSLNGRVRRIYKGTMKIRSSDLNSDLKYLNIYIYLSLYDIVNFR